MNERPKRQPAMARADFLRLAAGSAAGLVLGGGGGPAAAGTTKAMQRRAIPASGELLPVIGLGTYQGFDATPGSEAYGRLPAVLRTLLRRLHERPLPVWAGEIEVASWAQLLLKFVLSQPAVTCAIPGSGRPEHMADNAGAGRGRIPDAAFWRHHPELFDL